ncbi:hypothetical protein VTP01DRAFT_8583 [Rhizomucor pusillus]|uniref:uncharacterized protein n=1 Tax=Rhizomucor pusillus TaxID=4840 RepID=UPI0037420FBC
MKTANTDLPSISKYMVFVKTTINGEGDELPSLMYLVRLRHSFYMQRTAFLFYYGGLSSQFIQIMTISGLDGSCFGSLCIRNV